MAEDLEALITRGYRYALALTHDGSRAEDLVQDAWLAILKRDAPRHVGYLFRTIRNRFLDLEKRRCLVVVESLDAAEDQASNEVSPMLLDLSDLHLGLSKLRAVEREVFYLATVEGYTTAEVAAVTGHPPGTVSSLIQRSRAKLRRFFAGEEERRHG